MELFPEIEPYLTGYLDVGQGHSLYYEEVGNPNGVPVLYLHGGPGAGLSPKHRRYFNPGFWRIILLDQRGAGKSKPFASLQNNTTWDLVADLEKLRIHVGLTNWSIWGGSWGSKLALCYTALHRGKVNALMLRGIYLGREREMNWLYQEGASKYFPEGFIQFQSPITLGNRHNMVLAYHQKLNHTDQAVQLEAAKSWSTWEASLLKLLPDKDLVLEFQDPNIALSLSRLECHYAINKNFLQHDNLILEKASEWRDLPTRIVQGRYDMVCPPESAYELHQAITGSELMMVNAAGHSASDPELSVELVKMAWEFQYKVSTPKMRAI